jgi:DNA repair protein RadC
MPLVGAEIGFQYSSILPIDKRIIMHYTQGTRGCSAPHKPGKAKYTMTTYKTFSTTLSLKRTPLALRELKGAAPLGGCPADGAAIAHALIGDKAQEHLLLLTFDIRHQLTGVQTLNIGTTDGVNISVPDTIRVALLANAPSIMIVHNHPSGNLTPSPEDIQVTREIVAAARVFEIDVLDHLIVTAEHGAYVSIRERNPRAFAARLSVLD